MVAPPPQIITIAPTQPETVFVPAYDPNVVFGTWPHAGYPPTYFPPPVGWGLGNALLTGMAFAGGAAIVGSLWGWGSPNWGRGNINVNANRYNNINVNRAQISGNTWRHDTTHRQGVAYRNDQVRNKSARRAPGAGGADRAAARDQFRGRVDQAQRGEGIGNRPGAGDRPGLGDRAPARAVTVPALVTARPAAATVPGLAIARPAGAIVPGLATADPARGRPSEPRRPCARWGRPARSRDARPAAATDRPRRPRAWRGRPGRRQSVPALASAQAQAPSAPAGGRLWRIVPRLPRPSAPPCSTTRPAGRSRRRARRRPGPPRRACRVSAAAGRNVPPRSAVPPAARASPRPAPRRSSVPPRARRAAAVAVPVPMAAVAAAAARRWRWRTRRWGEALRMHAMIRTMLAGGLAALLLSTGAPAQAPAPEPAAEAPQQAPRPIPPQAFRSPEDGFAAFVAALRARSEAQGLRILGTRRLRLHPLGRPGGGPQRARPLPRRIRRQERDPAPRARPRRAADRR